MRTASLAWTVIALVVATSATARADALIVSPLEADSWPSAVAMLQADLHGDGRVVHVMVHDTSGARLTCSEYSLVLDPVAEQAFVVGACDPASDATPVQLAHRAALFDDDAIPHPRLAGITAIQIRQGGARGGAAQNGASELLCSVAVRPYINDMLHGRRVFVTPGRYVLRPTDVGVEVAVVGEAWRLSAHGQGSLSIAYEVVDTARNEVVVRTRATLACGAEEGMQPAATRPAAACNGYPPLALDNVVTGTTSGGRVQPTFAFRIPTERLLGFSLHGDFASEVDVYAGCGTSAERATVVRFAPGFAGTQRATLPAGIYSIVVRDQAHTAHAGAFSLSVVDAGP